MAFRDDTEALRARIQVLERELETLRDARVDRDRLKARVDELERELGIKRERQERAQREAERARAQRSEHLRRKVLSKPNRQASPRHQQLQLRQPSPKASTEPQQSGSRLAALIQTPALSSLTAGVSVFGPRDTLPRDYARGRPPARILARG